MNNNDIFQVLVLSNDDPLRPGSKLEELNTGQIGLFNADTNLSVSFGDGLPNKFFFAVGLDGDPSGISDIRKSAGEYIKKSLINRFDFVIPENGRGQTTVLELASFVPAPDTDYVIRVNFMSIGTLMTSGLNLPVKTFVISTPSGTTTDGDFRNLIVEAVNNDIEHLLVATIAGTTIEFTVAAEAKTNTLGGFNPKYHSLREFKFTVSLSAEFYNSVFTLTTPVELQYEQGSGYDIQQQEYIAGGWIGNPGVYRESRLTGLIGYTPKVYAIAESSYATIRLNYGFESHSGGNLEYNNELETLIAFSDNCANTGLALMMLLTSSNIPNNLPGGGLQ